MGGCFAFGYDELGGGSGGRSCKSLESNSWHE